VASCTTTFIIIDSFYKFKAVCETANVHELPHRREQNFIKMKFVPHFHYYADVNLTEFRKICIDAFIVYSCPGIERLAYCIFMGA